MVFKKRDSRPDANPLSTLHAETMYRGPRANIEELCAWSDPVPAGPGGPPLRRLFEEGTDVNSKDESGRTALWYEAMDGHVESCRALIEAGAKVEIKDKQGWAALCIAASNGHTTVVKLLLDHRADPTQVRGHGRATWEGYVGRVRSKGTWEGGTGRGRVRGKGGWSCSSVPEARPHTGGQLCAAMDCYWPAPSLAATDCHQLLPTAEWH